MADLSDVEAALVAAIDGIIYPGGDGAPCSIPGTPGVRIRRGWPASAPEDADLSTGVCVVTVYAQSGMTRLMSRYSTEFRLISSGANTMIVSLSQGSATFSGTGGGSQLAGVRALHHSYVHQVSDTDTPESVAAALAALVPGATAEGPTLHAPTGAYDFLVRTGAPALMMRELRRQVQGFRITCWCPSPELRDALASVIDAALADTDFLPLTDGSAAWVKYSGTFPDDTTSKDGLWRRDLRYSIEYATTQVQNVPTLLFGIENISVEPPGEPTITLIS